MRRSISEADCLAHYQKVDGANPSSAISVIEDLTKKEDAKNANPDPGFHHLVHNGKKRGNSMGSPCVQRLCSANYLSLCVDPDFSGLAKQNAGVAQLAAQLPCKQTVAGSIPAVGTGLWDDTRHVSQPQNPGQISSGTTNIAHRVAKQAGVALGTQ